MAVRERAQPQMQPGRLLRLRRPVGEGEQTAAEHETIRDAVESTSRAPDAERCGTGTARPAACGFGERAVVRRVGDRRSMGAPAPTEEEATDEAALRHAPARPHHATAAQPSEGSAQVGGNAKEGRALVTNRLPQAAACTPLVLGRPLRKARADPSPAELEVQLIGCHAPLQLLALGTLLVGALGDVRQGSLGEHRVFVCSLCCKPQLLLTLRVHQQHGLLCRTRPRRFAASV